MSKTYFLITALSLLLYAGSSRACTNFIVGKKASVDGSVMCTYNADNYGMFGDLSHYPAGKHPKGTMRTIRDWDTNKYLGEIPEAEETYNVIGNINEYQVTIGETTYGGRPEMVDSTGLIDYGSLIYIALQRSKTAREAIKVMTDLVETYGYCSSGETFSICDPNEAWIMEMMGQGAGSKKVVWVALRVPDDAICAHANQSRIGKFDMKDKKNVMYSKDVVKFARKQGWFSGKDEDFSWKLAYAFPDFEGRRFCDARVWSFFNHFKDMSPWLPWALGKDPNAEDMPLWIVPNRKVSVQDLEACMRDHYEGTPLSVADGENIGGGIWEMPYRPTPLTFTIDGKEYFNERPISTQQSGFVFVSQMRSSMPDVVGGVLWFGLDDANMTVFTPVYCNTDRVPFQYAEGNGDCVTFSWDSAFWIYNWVADMIRPRYSLMINDMRTVQNQLEDMYANAQAGIESAALKLYQESPQKAKDFLTDYTAMTAQTAVESWKKLAEFLIVRYNDGVVKRVKDGRLVRPETGNCAPLDRPGYSEEFLKRLVKETGDRYLMKKW